MNKMAWRYLFLGLILAFGAWLRTYNLTERYGFGWDQQDDAVKVMKMVRGESFTLIGPRVAGPDSFFVPAWHYYFLVPFYYFGKGSPWSGVAGSFFVGMITILCYYFTAKKLWGEKTALVAAWGGALAFSLVSWNVMYTSALTTVVFYLGSKMFSDKRYITPAIIVAFFAGSTHLVPMTLLLMIMVGIVFLKTKPSVKQVATGLMVGAISLLPLLIFDLRHDWLNTKKVIEFLFAQVGSGGKQLNFLAWRAYYRGFSFMTGYNIGLIWYVAERLILLALMVLGVARESDNDKRKWYVTWFVFPAIILLFYHQNIPEYYFGVPIALIPLFVAKNSTGRRGILTIVFLVLISIIQVRRVRSEVVIPSLTDKQRIVEFMISYSGNKKFNFSYNVPFGDEVGYPYLFSWKEKVPTSTDDSRLYSLITLPEKAGEKIIYKRAGLGIVER